MDQDMRRQLSDLEEMDQINESRLMEKLWVRRLMDNVQTTSNKAMLHWCSFIIRIGESEVDLEDNIAVYQQQVERIHDDLLLDIEQVHEKYLDKLMQLMQKLEQTCIDLHVHMPQFGISEDDVSISVPLGDVYKHIKQTCDVYDTVAEGHRKDVRELLQKQNDLCASLGRPSRLLPESPLPSASQLDELQEHNDRLESEKMDREEKFSVLKEEICQIVRELEVAPTLDFEKKVLSIGDHQILITDSTMEQLESFHARLINQRTSVTNEIQELMLRINELWEKLDVDTVERDRFRTLNTGNSLRVLEILKAEMRRCDQLKKANIEKFVTKQRDRLVKLWYMCHVTENERDSFPYFRSDLYSEDLLELYEHEVTKWAAFYEDNKGLFKLLDEYRTLWFDWLSLERNFEKGTDRYKNRGGQLLAEEKQRNKLTKRLPKVEEDLVKMARDFTVRKGREFLTHGRSIQEYIDGLREDRDKDNKERLSAKMLQREKVQLTSANFRPYLFSSSGNSAVRTAPMGCSKRKLLTSAAATTTKKTRLSTRGKKKTPVRNLPRLNVPRTKRRKVYCTARRSLTSTSTALGSDKENGSSDYSNFADDTEVTADPETDHKLAHRDDGPMQSARGPSLNESSQPRINVLKEATDQAPPPMPKTPIKMTITLSKSLRCYQEPGHVQKALHTHLTRNF